MVTPENRTLETSIVEYWDRQPCNSKNSDKSQGTLEYFEEIKRNRYFVEPHIPHFAEFSSFSGKNVLEIGCGIGTDGAMFAQNGANYSGIDLSKSSIELAKKNFSIRGLNADLYHSTQHDLSDILSKFNDKHFDLIYSFGVLHHSTRAQDIVNSLPRVLKLDGEFRFMVYALNSWKSILIDCGEDQFEAQYGCPLAERYDNEMVKDLLGSKFILTEISQDHIFWWEINAYKKREYVMLDYFKLMPEQFRLALKKKLGWHLLVKSKLNNLEESRTL
jgi:2-polyprenyl-3-methyl-5-hydroxy-6-metoxy-1,4-benzoquinol methylase